MHTNTSSSAVISRRVFNKCKYANQKYRKKKYRNILKYAAGMSSRQRHQKITEYSGKPIDKSELLGHTLDIYQIQHLLGTEQTSWPISTLR